MLATNKQRMAERLANALGWTLEQVALTGFAIIIVFTWAVILAAIRDGLSRKR